jgi:hypothetical protein
MKMVQSSGVIATSPKTSGASSLREAISFWFAISSPLIGVIVGFLGAWFVAFLTI